MLSYTISMCLPSGTHFLQASATEAYLLDATSAMLRRWAYEIGLPEFDHKRAKLEVYQKHTLIASKSFLSRKWTKHDQSITTGNNEVQRLPALSDKGPSSQVRVVRVARSQPHK